LSSTYLVAPLLAIALVRILGPANGGAGSEGYHFFEAMMIVAAQAGTIASAPALTLVAGGNQALALLITLSSNLLTSVVTPLILRLTVGTMVAFPVGRMMREDALVVLLPVIAGQIAHRLFWSRLRRSLPVIVRLPQAIILVFVYTGVAMAASHLSQRPALILSFLATAASLHVALLVWNHRSATWLGLSEGNRTAVVFCGSQKTLPNGIYLWDTFFPANPHGAFALVCYHVFQLVLDSLLVPWLSPRRPRLEELEEAVDGA
jgi:sodium/bile acid cotransporter 7